jgi:hypothetical protein
MAADRINIGLLAHIAGFGTRESVTAVSIKSIEVISGYVYEKIGPGLCDADKTLADACRISVFPHDQRPGVTASLIGAMAGDGIRPYALGSSPSAMTVVVSASDFHSTMERLFDAFSFHAHESYEDWLVACRGRENSIEDVRCSYHERIITISDFAHRADLDMWCVKLPLGGLGGFVAALAELDGFGIRMPFFVSISPPDEENIYFSFLFGAVHHDRVERTLAGNIPAPDLFSFGRVAAFFLHGPHFGDRYGIADALVKALYKAGVPLLTVGCAVSSISLAVRAGDLDQTVEALNSVFRKPDNRA